MGDIAVQIELEDSEQAHIPYGLAIAFAIRLFRIDQSEIFSTVLRVTLR